MHANHIERLACIAAFQSSESREDVKAVDTAVCPEIQDYYPSLEFPTDASVVIFRAHKQKTYRNALQTFAARDLRLAKRRR